MVENIYLFSMTIVKEFQGDRHDHGEKDRADEFCPARHDHVRTSLGPEQLPRAHRDPRRIIYMAAQARKKRAN